MVADDRSGPPPAISSLPVTPAIGAEIQSASFEIGGVHLELAATTGGARLIVDVGGARDSHVIDPTALTAWSAATMTLLTLSAASGPDGRAEFRAPYAVDRDGRASIAFEGLVTEHGVGYRLLVARASNAVTGVMTTRELVLAVAEAAAGAAVVIRKAG